MAEPSPIASFRCESAGADTRAAAARVLQAVRDQGRSLPDALDAVIGTYADRDASLLQELSYGAVRMLPRLEVLTSLLLHKPLKRDNGDLLALIQIGLYQIMATRVPEHAAVASTVEATRGLGKGWAASLVNALLRRFLRERDGLIARADRSPESKWLFPGWLLKRLQTSWPEHWQSIIEASNANPPMILRVNPLRTSRTEYAQRLAAAGLTARPAPYVEQGLVLERPVPVQQLPGFEDGLVSVQDAGAQLAADLLDAKAGMRVLDACAAPGGKTAHILERAGGMLDLTSLDVEPARLARVRDNLARLGLSARVMTGDASEPGQDWSLTAYDRILLDVPCSATGVIRRHPDIKLLRRESDIATVCALQSRILDRLWPLLAPGGTLLYVTCSLLPEENERQIQAFLTRRPDACEHKVDAPWGVAREVGRQTLPGTDDADGFYFARLEKRVR